VGILVAVTDELVVDEVMAEVRARVRQRVRADLARHAPGSPLLDSGIFDEAEALFRRALDARRHLVVPTLLLDDEEWELATALRFRSHRRSTGRLVLFLKRHVLLPLTRWLFEYTRDNFERQARVNETLMASIEVLVVEVVQLRRELQARGAESAAPESPGLPRR
jgi:hypothetical protein